MLFRSPFQSSCQIAVGLGYRFGVIIPLSKNIKATRHRVHGMKLLAYLASVSAVDIPVLELRKDTGGLLDILSEISKKLTQQDGADVIVVIDDQYSLSCHSFLRVSPGVPAVWFRPCRDVVAKYTCRTVFCVLSSIVDIVGHIIACLILDVKVFLSFHRGVVQYARSVGKVDFVHDLITLRRNECVS